MPKQKTHRAAAKRFKMTANGKFLRKKAYRSHLNVSMTAKRKRNLDSPAVVDETDAIKLRKDLPYPQYIR